MSPIGHFAVGLAAKPAASKVPLAVLLVAAMALDLLAMVLGWAGIEGDTTGYPWSHGLFMSALWSVAAALLGARICRDYRSGVVIGLMIFSHWVLDFISHPIPFASFSWHSWQWSYGHPMPPTCHCSFPTRRRWGWACTIPLVRRRPLRWSLGCSSWGPSCA